MIKILKVKDKMLSISCKIFSNANDFGNHMYVRVIEAFNPKSFLNPNWVFEYFFILYEVFIFEFLFSSEYHYSQRI